MTHGSLFSGIGGFDLAAEMMGWENVFHCEIEEFQRKVLHKNFPNAKSYSDIRKFDGTIFRDRVTILSGGFPCQDISIGNTKGAQGIKGSRSGLWKEYARIIREIRPKFIVFENSPELIRRGLEYVLCDLSEMGYDAEWRNFYASQFGFPHLRERIYGIAYPPEIGRACYSEQGGILHKIIPTKKYREGCLPRTFKRFNSHSDFESVRMYDGFSKKLDINSIGAYGNAIVPAIALEIFKAIKEINF